MQAFLVLLSLVSNVFAAIQGEIAFCPTGYCMQDKPPTYQGPEDGGFGNFPDGGIGGPQGPEDGNFGNLSFPEDGIGGPMSGPLSMFFECIANNMDTQPQNVSLITEVFDDSQLPFDESSNISQRIYDFMQSEGVHQDHCSSNDTNYTNYVNGSDYYYDSGPGCGDCGEGSFCNYDPGDSFCEPCSDFTSVADCQSDGLPPRGAEDCAYGCFGVHIYNESESSSRDHNLEGCARSTCSDEIQSYVAANPDDGERNLAYLFESDENVTADTVAQRQDAASLMPLFDCVQTKCICAHFPDDPECGGDGTTGPGGGTIVVGDGEVSGGTIGVGDGAVGDGTIGVGEKGDVTAAEGAALADFVSEQLEALGMPPSTVAQLVETLASIEIGDNSQPKDLFKNPDVVSALKTANVSAADISALDTAASEADWTELMADSNDDGDGAASSVMAGVVVTAAAVAAALL